MKLLKSKKGFVFSASSALFIVIIVVFVFGFSGVIKFMLTDKTPLILGGAFLFLLLLGQKKRENR